MLSRYTHKKITWIDLESPTKDEVTSIMKEFNVHPIIANELLSPTFRPKVDVYDNFIYLIMHFPIVNENRDVNNEQEIDFIIGEDFIITTHYETIDPLHDFSRIFEVDSIIDKSNLGTHAGFIFYYIIMELYKTLSLGLDIIDKDLRKVENKIFDGEERKMLEEISSINRKLLDFNQSFRLHKDILSSLEFTGKQFFGEKFTSYIRSILGEYYKVSNHLEGNKDTVVELRDTNDSLLSAKQNEIMKVLTVLAFITFPLSLLASIFGMNAVNMPIVGTSGDFWLIISIMMIATFFMFGFFRYKKWF